MTAYIGSRYNRTMQIILIFLWLFFSKVAHGVTYHRCNDQETCTDCVFNNSTFKLGKLLNNKTYIYIYPSQYLTFNFIENITGSDVLSNVKINGLKWTANTNNMEYTWTFNGDINRNISISIYQITDENSRAVPLHGCCNVPIYEQRCRVNEIRHDIVYGVNYNGERGVDVRRINLTVKPGKNITEQNGRYLHVCPPPIHNLPQRICPCVTLDTSTGSLLPIHQNNNTMLNILSNGGRMNNTDGSCMFHIGRDYVHQHGKPIGKSDHGESRSVTLPGYYWLNNQLYDAQHQPVNCTENDRNSDYTCIAVYKGNQSANVACVPNFACFIQMEVVSITVKGQVFHVGGDPASKRIGISITMGLASCVLFILMMYTACHYRHKVKKFFKPDVIVPPSLTTILGSPCNENQTCQILDYEIIDPFTPGENYGKCIWKILTGTQPSPLLTRSNRCSNNIASSKPDAKNNTNLCASDISVHDTHSVANDFLIDGYKSKHGLFFGNFDNCNRSNKDLSSWSSLTNCSKDSGVDSELQTKTPPDDDCSVPAEASINDPMSVPSPDSGFTAIPATHNPFQFNKQQFQCSTTDITVSEIIKNFRLCTAMRAEEGTVLCNHEKLGNCLIPSHEDTAIHSYLSKAAFNR
ncbi:uncharacterized protein LOC108951124 [Ciona intestinalis]